MKRYLDILLWAILYFVIPRAKRVAVYNQYKPIERRRNNYRAHWVGGDRRNRVEPPVLTFSLKVTITGCVMAVSSIAMLYASYGAHQALLIIPVFIAYIYLVLFVQTIINQFKYRNQRAEKA